MIQRLVISAFIFLGTAGFLFFSNADITNAQLITRIVPECEGIQCDTCQLVLLLNNLIQFFVYLSVVVATLLFTWAGALYVTSSANQEHIDKAKKIFGNVLIGLIVVLAAWIIVDTIIRAISSDSAPRDNIAPWADVLCDGSSRAPLRTSPETGGINPVTGGADPDGRYDYDPGIEAQMAHASPALRDLLSCMQSGDNAISGDSGRISSISDSAIVSGQRTFEECAAGASGCAHTTNSRHYGGEECTGQSYAVDFGDQQNSGELAAAARRCGADSIINEGTHLHVGVPVSC